MKRSALLVLAMLFGACSDAPKITEPATVVVVGDSLLYASTEPVERALRQRGWLPVIDGRPGSTITGGYSIDSWPARIEQLVRTADPDVAVIELGTNGCGDCLSVDAGIDAVMRPLRELPRVYWVNLREDAPIPSRPQAINDAIERAADRFDNLRVIDMNEHFADHPELLSADNIHFNAAGERAFARLVADTLPDES